jgi:chromosomal replication initiation ATPase DnaA
MQLPDPLTYNDLQKALDKVVGKIGLENAIQLLRKAVEEKPLLVSSDERTKLITCYIIFRCQEIFSLKDKQFYVSKIPEYREGRMACFYLLKKYTNASYSKIAEQFYIKPRTVMYFNQKCFEMISVPEFYRIFSARFRDLENCIIEFMAKLNLKGTKNEDTEDRQ